MTIFIVCCCCFVVVVVVFNVVVVEHNDQVEHEDVRRGLAERCYCRRMQK